MSGPDREDLARTVARLGGMVADLEARVAALEGVGPVPAPATRTGDEPETEDLGRGATQLLFLLGRSILLLAGAFLLRTLTEGGTLPPLVGFLAGVLLAFGILAMADRVGVRGERGSAAAYGMTAALIAYPLLLETTGISSLVTAGVGAVALALLTAGGLLVAARTRVRFLAFVFTVAATATSVILMFALDAPILFNAVLLTVGVGTLVVAYARGWRLERWLPALVSDALILRLVIMAADPERDPSTGPSPGAVTALALALLLVYLVIFTYRTLVLGRGARVFYVIQSTAVLLIGYGGAVRIITAHGGSGALLGWLAVLAAAGYYAAAFTVVRQRHGRGEGFFYSALLGLVLLVLGSRVIVPPALLGWIWMGLGAAAAILASRFDRGSLRLHSAVYLAVAGVQTGLFAATGDAFLGRADATWHPLTIGAAATLVTAAACYALVAWTARNDGPQGVTDRLPRFGILLTALCGAGTAAVYVLVRALGDAPPDAVPGTVAVIRTGIIACTAVVLAWQARHTHVRELAWPVYPLLVLDLVRILVQDLRHGTPLTLTVGFALCGVALIMAPRLLAAGRESAES